MDVDVINHLDQSVNNWSDYNRIYYHPRSINQITTHQMDDDVSPFDNYTIGRQAYKDNEKEADTFDENVRFFAEECDSLQGFQILTNVDDAFGGFTEGLLSDMRDEYAKTPIITYGLSDSHAAFRTERIKQKIILNRALSMSRLSESSSDYSLYHTSAIIAAAIDTVTLPFRLKRNPITFADCVHRLNWVRSSKLASLSVSFPLPIYETVLIPNAIYMQKVDIYGETVVTRGLPETRLVMAYHICVYRYNISSAFPLPDSYPRLFTPNINPDGYRIPLMTHFMSGSALESTVNNQVKQLEKLNFKDFYEYSQGESGLSTEDFIDTKESLMSLLDCYE
ncbi:tubulin nucleotide-binding domain-like protein [Backusella circina FSU 941]|nr:tubulin nucleotide-binding domain-like protein [Backusella circina FSU 941]